MVGGAKRKIIKESELRYRKCTTFCSGSRKLAPLTLRIISHLQLRETTIATIASHVAPASTGRPAKSVIERANRNPHRRSPSASEMLFASQWPRH